MVCRTPGTVTRSGADSPRPSRPSSGWPVPGQPAGHASQDPCTPRAAALRVLQRNTARARAMAPHRFAPTLRGAQPPWPGAARAARPGIARSMRSVNLASSPPPPSPFAAQSTADAWGTGASQQPAAAPASARLRSEEPGPAGPAADMVDGTWDSLELGLPHDGPAAALGSQDSPFERTARRRPTAASFDMALASPAHCPNPFRVASLGPPCQGSVDSSAPSSPCSGPGSATPSPEQPQPEAAGGCMAASDSGPSSSSGRSRRTGSAEPVQQQGAQRPPAAAAAAAAKAAAAASAKVAATVAEMAAVQAAAALQRLGRLLPAADHPTEPLLAGSVRVESSAADKPAWAPDSSECEHTPNLPYTDPTAACSAPAASQQPPAGAPQQPAAGALAWHHAGQPSAGLTPQVRTALGSASLNAMQPCYPSCTGRGGKGGTHLARQQEPGICAAPAALTAHRGPVRHHAACEQAAGRSSAAPQPASSGCATASPTQAPNVADRPAAPASPTQPPSDLSVQGACPDCSGCWQCRSTQPCSPPT